MIKNILYTSALIIIAIVGYIFFTAKPVNLAKETKAGPLDISYEIEGQKIIFQNGKAEVLPNPGASSSTKFMIFSVSAEGDLNNDGISDYGVLLTKDGGGSGTFFYIGAAMTDNLEKVVGTNAIFIGDRIAPQNTRITDGIIEVNYAKRKDGEPMTARPSMGVTGRYRVENGILLETRFPQISIEEARDIAKKNIECSKAGRLSDATTTPSVFYNENSGTWWIMIFPSGPRQDCNPACVVNDQTKQAEINWRCTGLKVPN